MKAAGEVLAIRRASRPLDVITQLAHAWQEFAANGNDALVIIVQSVKRQRNRDFYSDARRIGALKNLQQTFPSPWLYVAELLQKSRLSQGASNQSGALIKASPNP